MREVAQDNARRISGKSGADHPRWNGGHRGRPASTKKWRDAVLAVNHRTCAACGAVGEKIVAHHMDAYALHPERRLDPGNGMSLCDTCHRRLHAIYGHAATLEDACEFIGAPAADRDVLVPPILDEEIASAPKEAQAIVNMLLRAGRKGDAVTDLEKGLWYLQREITNRKAAAK